MHKLLLFLHLVAAVVALASAVHMFLRLLRGLHTHSGYFALKRLHARTLAVAYLVCFALGALLYPRFRMHVRHDFLDEAHPLGTALFEMKEHVAALALLPVLWLFLYSRNIDFAASGMRPFAFLMGGLLLFVLAVIIYASVSGWYLVTLRSV